MWSLEKLPYFEMPKIKKCVVRDQCIHSEPRDFVRGFSVNNWHVKGSFINRFAQCFSHGREGLMMIMVLPFGYLVTTKCWSMKWC